jgi:L-2-hydroxyglutarate oxidase
MLYDYLIVGGGIVGLSTCVALLREKPESRIALLEKEDGWAKHQTGRNSGVIHSGIYYRPGSLKAQMAKAGNQSMISFCREWDIPHEVCGKIIVATEETELIGLERLYERGIANGLEVRRLSIEEARESEPHLRGIRALHVASTGIVDYRSVCARITEIAQAKDASLFLNACVVDIQTASSHIEVVTTQGTYETAFLINCSGLHCDRIAKMSGLAPPVQIVPFRGEYYTLAPEKCNLVRNLIYPVPDPAFPFLGVHFTRMISGEVHAGPNAVLSLKREGYTKLAFNPFDLAETMTFSGFWRLGSKHWRAGAREIARSWSNSQFVKSLQRLIPEVEAKDLLPAEPGVRAQAVHPDGSLEDDFMIVDGRRSLHLLNAPSPAATASLEIGRYVARRVVERTDSD